MNRLEQSSFSFLIFRSGQGAFQQMHSGEATCFYGKKGIQDVGTPWSLHSAGQPSSYCQDGQIDCTRIPTYPTFFWLKLKLNRARVTAVQGSMARKPQTYGALLRKSVGKFEAWKGMERPQAPRVAVVWCFKKYPQVTPTISPFISIFCFANPTVCLHKDFMWRFMLVAISMSSMALWLCFLMLSDNSWVDKGCPKSAKRCTQVSCHRMTAWNAENQRQSLILRLGTPVAWGNRDW